MNSSSEMETKDPVHHWMTADEQMLSRSINLDYRQRPRFYFCLFLYYSSSRTVTPDLVPLPHHCHSIEFSFKLSHKFKVIKMIRLDLGLYDFYDFSSKRIYMNFFYDLASFIALWVYWISFECQ